MLDRMYGFWLNLRSSLWALPLLMSLIAVAAALALVRVDIELGDHPPWYLYSGTPDGASQFLSDLVTAIITMATLAISITMVVLTLAAQQLGPRLIRSFMADRRTQMSLGLMTATVVYLILVLRSVYATATGVPNIAVTVGTALVLINIVALLVFVHHLARSIIADTVIAQVGGLLDDEIERLLPGRDDDGKSRRPQQALADFPQDGAPLPLPESGYIQGIDHDRLVKTAAEADAVISLQAIPGDYGIEGAAFGEIAPRDCLQEETLREIQAALRQGSSQSSVQDLRFYIHQLVEIALRALSPSVSDPFTAIAAIDRLAAAMAKVMAHRQPQSVWCDEDGKVRLIAPRYSFPSLVEASFFQIREMSRGSPYVEMHLLRALAQLSENAQADQRPALLRQAKPVARAIEHEIEDDEMLRLAKRRLASVESGEPAAG